MKIRILGAHNIESKNTGCACLLIDGVLAIDAGAVTSTLSLKAQGRIKAVLLTHRHYDHVKDLPGLGMNFYLMGKSLEVYAIQSVFRDLAPHYSDEVLYPDFTLRPPEKPTLTFKVLEPGKEISAAGYRILPVPMKHAVPVVGFQITAPGGEKLFYTSDTGPGLDECWRQVAPDLLIIEVNYINKYEELGLKTGHLTPALLQKELEGFRKLKGYLPGVVTVHANPLDEEVLTAELARTAGALKTDISPGREGMLIDL
jgi:ribonuclease BN (tRNA processing enzyme)